MKVMKMSTEMSMSMNMRMKSMAILRKCTLTHMVSLGGNLRWDTRPFGQGPQEYLLPGGVFYYLDLLRPDLSAPLSPDQDLLPDLAYLPLATRQLPDQVQGPFLEALCLALVKDLLRPIDRLPL